MASSKPQVMFMVSDNHLIQLTAKADQKAFAQLMHRYQDHIYSVCYSILKTQQEAQEAAQDTFVKIYKSAGTFNEGSKLSSWMYKIAYRTSLDYIRKRKATHDIEDVAYSLATEDSSADRDMEHDERREAIVEAINQLPEEESGLIRLFYLEEMSIKDLVEVTGLGLSNVKVKLYRARKKLFEIIRDDYAELSQYKYE